MSKPRKLARRRFLAVATAGAAACWGGWPNRVAAGEPPPVTDPRATDGDGCWGVKFGLAEGNRIRDNRDYGVSVGHNDTDNILRDNEITGSGKTRDLRIVRNEIRETRGPARRIGIRIGPDAANIQLADNLIEGFAQPVADERSTDSGA